MGAHSVRVVFSICALSLIAAVYCGYVIIAETHLHPADSPSPVPGARNALAYGAHAPGSERTGTPFAAR